jgi:phage shock protein A
MKDNIRTRIGRILTGTANSIVSKIEGLAPEVVLQQAIHEVDSAIDEVKVEQGKIKAQKHHVGKAITRLNMEHDKIAGEMEVASQQGREELLKAGISRQLDIEDQLPALQQQLEALAQQLDELDKAITGLLAKRNEMEDELFEFRRNQSSSVAGQEVGGVSGSSALDKADRADRAFSRVIQNTTGVRRESLRASNAEAEQLRELSMLSKQARIEARIREFKSKED